MRKINITGGPLNGKTYLIHENRHTFTHHADTTGHYTVEGNTATWADTATTITTDTDSTETDDHATNDED